MKRNKQKSTYYLGFPQKGKLDTLSAKDADKATSVKILKDGIVFSKDANPAAVCTLVGALLGETKIDSPACLSDKGEEVEVKPGYLTLDILEELCDLLCGDEDSEESEDSSETNNKNEDVLIAKFESGEATYSELLKIFK